VADLAYVSLSIAFFALAALYVWAAGRSWTCGSTSWEPSPSR